MSAPNFFYKNRCVVATDADFDNENYPTLTQERGVKPSDYYNTNVVDVEPFLEEGEWVPIYHRVVMNTGRYQDACIDYVEHGDFSVDDYLPNCVCTQEEITICLTDSLPLTKYRVRKLMGKRGIKDYYEWYREFVERADAYLKEEERKMCDRIIDRIREEFGFKEYVCSSVMSNGEAIYNPVENPVGLRKPVEQKIG